MNVFDEANNKLERITVVNTNACSLCPKMNSLIDYFNELDTTFAIVTETWLSDGHGLEKYLRDLQDGSGLTMTGA